MAKIHEEVIVLKLSCIVKDGVTAGTITNDELLTTLESVAQELLGDSIVVEATVA